MVESILAAPVLVRVLGALALMLVINAFCKHLIVSVAAGTLALALWSGHNAASMVQVSWARLSSVDNLFLMLIVFQVLWLSSQMAVAGVMKDLVAAVRARVSQHAAMAVLPAMIGLLPMPGGALFSAPLVDSVDADRSISPELKAQTNHWFRHVWEYWWPLHPGVLLAMSITGLDVWQFMLLGIPLSLCGIGAGYAFLLRPIGHGQHDPHSPGPGVPPAPALFVLVLPILVVILMYTVVRLGHAGLALAWPGIGAMNRYVPMAAGLLCAMLVLQVHRPLTGGQWRSIVLSGRAINIALIVAAVSVYAAFIGADLPSGKPLVWQMYAEITTWGIPLKVIIMMLPLVSGLATGLSIGFVGASFPIVLTLVGQSPSAGEVLSTTALAYAFGYIGMLLSPMHVCLVVTSEHFGTSILRNVGGLLKPSMIILACAFLFHLLLGWIFV